MKAVVFLLLLFSAQLTSNAQTTRIGDTCSGQYLEYTPLPNKPGYHVKEWYYDRLLFEGNCREKIQVKQFDSILEKEYPENEKYFYESLRHDKLKVKMNNYFLDSFVLYDGLDNIRKKYLIDKEGYITYIKMRNLEVSLSGNLSFMYFSGINEEYRRRFRINGRKEQDTIFVTYATDNGKFTDTLLKQQTKYSKIMYQELNNKYYLVVSYNDERYSDWKFLKPTENNLVLFDNFSDLRSSRFSMLQFRNMEDYFEYASSSISTINLSFFKKYLYNKGQFILIEEPLPDQTNNSEIVAPGIHKDCDYRDSIKMEDYRKGKIIKTCYEYYLPGTTKKFSDTDLVHVSYFEDESSLLFYYGNKSMGLKTRSGRWVVGPKEKQYYNEENTNGERYFIKKDGDFYKLYNCYGQDMYPNDMELDIIADNAIAIVNDSFSNRFKLNYLSSGIEIFGTGKIKYNPLIYRDNYNYFEIEDYRSRKRGLIYNGNAYIPPVYSTVYYNSNLIIGFKKDSQRLEVYTDKGELKSNFSGVDSLGFNEIADKELITFKCNLGWIVYNLKNFKYCTLSYKPYKSYILNNIIYILNNGKMTIFTKDFEIRLFVNADSVIVTENSFVAFKNNRAYFGNMTGKIFSSIPNIEVHKNWFLNPRNIYNREYINKYIKGFHISDNTLLILNSFIFKKGEKFGLIGVEGRIIRKAIYNDIGMIFANRSNDFRNMTGLYFIKNGITEFLSINDSPISEKSYHIGKSLVYFNELFIGKKTKYKLNGYVNIINEQNKFHKIMNKEKLSSGEMMDYAGNRSFEGVGMKKIEYIENGYYYYKTMDNKLGLKNCTNTTLFELSSVENILYDVNTDRIAVQIGKYEFKLYSLKTNKYHPDTFDMPPVAESKNGIAIIRQKQKFGLLNANGEYLTNPNYSWISYSQRNKTFVMVKNNQYELYIENLKTLIKTSYEHIQPLYNYGFIAYKSNNVYLLDSLGHLIDSSNTFFYNSKKGLILKLIENNVNKIRFDNLFDRIKGMLPEFEMKSIDSSLIKMCSMFPQQDRLRSYDKTHMFPNVNNSIPIIFVNESRKNCIDLHFNTPLAATKASVFDYSFQIYRTSRIASFKHGFSASWETSPNSYDFSSGSRIYYLTDTGLLRLHSINLIDPTMKDKLEKWLHENWENLEGREFPKVGNNNFYKSIMDCIFFVGDKVIFFEMYNITVSMSLNEFNQYLKPEWKGKFN